MSDITDRADKFVRSVFRDRAGKVRPADSPPPKVDEKKLIEARKRVLARRRGV